MTRVIGRFPNETSALVMVFSILEGERLKWQKVRMRAEDIAWIEEAAKDIGAGINQTGIPGRSADCLRKD